MLQSEDNRKETRRQRESSKRNTVYKRRTLMNQAPTTPRMTTPSGHYVNCLPTLALREQNHMSEQGSCSQEDLSTITPVSEPTRKKKNSQSKLKISISKETKLQQTFAIISRFYRVLTKLYTTKNYWVFGLCPSSGF
jgi:hypothetical protein